MIPVAAGLIVRDGRLLVAQRPAGTHLAGLWEFPGGKVQPGESWEDALQRELQEELDCTVHVGALYEEVVHPYPGKTVHLRFYRCSLTQGEPRPVECAAVTWTDRERLRQFEFPPADARLLDRLQADTAFWA